MFISLPMENFVVEEKIKQKEIEIIKKLQDLKNSDELGQIIAEHTCIWNQCFFHIDPIERDAKFSKICISDAIEYFGNIENLFIEKLKKETLTQLWELLILYLDKREIYQGLRD